MSLLHAVMQKFRTDNVFDQPDLTTDDEPPTTPTDFSLTGLMGRFAPLIDLQSRRQLVTVQLDNQRQHFQTLLLDINFSQGLLVFDELFPAAPSLRLGQQLHFSHQHLGKVMQFSAAIIARETIAGSPCYLVPLPDNVEYRQRRRHSRFEFDRLCLPVKIHSPWRSHWFGSIVNISASGIRVTVNGDKLKEMSRGSRIPHLSFELSKQLRISCEGKVCSFRFLRRPHRQTEISIEFAGLNAEHYALLSQYVDTLQGQSYQAA